MPKSGQYNETYPLLLEQENKIQLLDQFRGAKEHHKMKCLVCNYEWVATPISKRQTYKKNGVGGCPNCDKTRKEQRYSISRQENLKKLAQRGIEVLDDKYDGRRHMGEDQQYVKIKVRNNNCGHEFYCSPTNLLALEVECGICGPQKRVEPLTRWSKANSAKWQETADGWQRYKAEVSRLTAETYKKFKHIINPKNLKRGNAGTPGAHHLDHIVPKRFCFENNVPPEICADVSNLQMLGWRDNVGSRNNIKGVVPPIFFQYIEPSDLLKQQIKFIKENAFPHAEQFVRIGNTVVTLYDQKSNHAVVNISTSKPYANLKTAATTMKELQQEQVTYSILFDDEFSKKDIVVSKLKHYSKQNAQPNIHARKCTIKHVDPKTKSAFLESNHIQGNDNAQITYGAFYNDNLVAIMTFTKPRVAVGHKGDDGLKFQGKWELSRFATDIRYRVTGAAGKLLTHFKNNNKWSEIYSYADRRWSVGKLYQTLGFDVATYNPPSYWYIVDGQRKHRWNYRKDVLKDKLECYDATATEYENMVDHGYHRVWDCGTIKFVLKNDV